MHLIPLLVPFILGMAGLVAGIVIALAGWDRYRNGPSHPGNPTLQPTTEVFIDPETGARMRVWFDPGSGERSYRTDGPGPPPPPR